jgi:hypothetical protein
MSLAEGCMAVGSDTYTKDIGRLITTRALSVKVWRTDRQERGPLTTGTSPVWAGMTKGMRVPRR